MRWVVWALSGLALAGCAGPEAQVLRAEDRWMAAMQARDAATLEAMVAPGFTLAGDAPSDRPPVGRTAWIDNSLHHLRLSDVQFDARSAEVRGDTATVRATLTWAGAYDGDAFRETVQLVDVWRKVGGRWRVLSRRVGVAREG